MKLSESDIAILDDQIEQMTKVKDQIRQQLEEMQLNHKRFGVVLKILQTLKAMEWKLK
jgi:hypothetical protein